MKIGIPRALFYFRYGRFWQQFFNHLGIETVVSPKTNKDLLDIGLKKVSSEICLPIKIVCGHLEWLKDKVDTIFLPRIVELNHGLYSCPKMIGIVDIARMQVGNQCQILSPKIKNNFIFAHFLLGLNLTKNPYKARKALNKALPYLNNHKTNVFDNHKPKILLLSHFYNLEDDFIGQDIKAAFIENGFAITTKEVLDQTILNSANGFAKNIQWIYERELYNAFHYNLTKVDGVCDIISFGCGPDSLVGEIMNQHANQNKVPFLQLIIDEHTSKTGLVTRIEAFSEIIKRKTYTTDLHK
ncbi:MAG: hypothetical protein KGZ86_01550 [Candidatus Latescibacteria bacterium]|nr:hypothetical protein [Candidatus Latescibacterota bacterium]